MSKINVQLLFTEKEYEKLRKEAYKYGLTVPLYVKGEVLKDDDFTKSYRSLILRVNMLPSGTKFNIRSLFGVDWTMSKGVKLNLGKTYFNSISKGVIDNVNIVGKDSSKVMWYEKK